MSQRMKNAQNISERLESYRKWSEPKWTKIIDYGSWDITSFHIIPITDELIQKETKMRKIEKINSFKDWNKLGTCDIDQIYKILFKRDDST